LSKHKIISTAENLQVIYEDNHLIAVNKRVGDIVQGDKTGDLPLSEHVKEYIKRKYGKPGNVFLGVTHRLDRPTTGVVVFARTSKALARMNRLFAEKDTKKIYWAIVKKAPAKKKDVLVHWLKRNPKQNKSYAYLTQVEDSKRAELQYSVLRELDKYTLLEIELITGRHHQIRAQLAALECPIKGDLKYGADRSNPDGGIHLHARSLAFEHPVKKEWMQLLAPPPDDILWNACL
jgi:23S rRNA pseudouridine1911/1915/1917 synthase